MSDDKSLHILLKPHSNSNNKKILDFLHIQQKKINNNNMVIKPQIMNSDKIDDFVKIGVSNLPSLLYHGKIVYGVNEIIKYINKICINDGELLSNPKPKNDADDDIRAYMLDAALNDDDEEMEAPISDKEIRNNRFVKNKKNKKNDDGDNYDYNNIAVDEEDEEDELMLNYLRNQEVTDS